MDIESLILVNKLDKCKNLKVFYQFTTPPHSMERFIIKITNLFNH